MQNMDTSKTIFKVCEECHKEFKAKSTFYLHRKVCKKRILDDNLKTCTCGKSFKQRSYYNHIKNCEHASQESRSKISENFLCFEENCTFVSQMQNDFINHLKDMHSICCEDEIKIFQDYAEFEDWKENFEKTTKSAFILARTMKNKAGIQKDFMCNRSGIYKSKQTGKRSVKSQGLLKIGHKCTANIKIQLHDESPTVKATISPMHYGHDNILAHTRIAKSDRMLIANQLSNGLEHPRILLNMLSMFPNDLERQHLVTKQDLRNISRAFGIERVGVQSELKESNDYSVDAYVAEDLEKENNIFLFKNQGEITLHHPKDETCTLEKDDFALGIMTDFQKQMLLKFGNNIVCLDTIHGVNSHDFKLITLLVVDEFKVGVPVAFFICNRETYTCLYLFFRLIQKQIGRINPTIMMTDKEPQYHSAFVDVFQVNPKKLLCHWNIRHDWQKNLNKIHKKELSSTIYKKLCRLLEEASVRNFQILLESFLIKLFEDKDTEDFAWYFNDEWMPIKEEWAKCYRIGVEINTNMYLECFHKTFKYGRGYLHGKQIGKCLNILLQFAKDLPIQRLGKLEKKKNKRKSAVINKQHKESLVLPLSLVENISPDTWRVHSEKSFHSATTSSDNLIYDIKKQPECKRNCEIRCYECAICLHSYTCSCPDGLLIANICKHVHLVARSLGIEISYDGQNSLQDIENEDLPLIGTPSQTELTIDNSNIICKDVTSDENTNLTILKSNLVSKVMALCEIIKHCDNKDLLLTAGSHITSAASVLKLKM